MIFHAHIYFEPDQLAEAVQLREELGRLSVRTGHIHTQPVGPHPKPMFQALFTSDRYQVLRDWLARHRGNLDVLLHRETGDPIKDHTDHVEWLGRAHNLNLNRL